MMVLLKKNKNRRCDAAKKRLEKTKMIKGEKCVFDNDDSVTWSSDVEVLGDAADAVNELKNKSSDSHHLHVWIIFL